MLSAAQTERIEDLLHSGDYDHSQLLRELPNFVPDELVYLISAYNWDDGFEVPLAIAKHPRCCRAIALALFHAGAGDAWLENAEHIDEYSRDWDDFCRCVSEGIASGRYPVGALSYTPPYDRVALYKIKKAGVLPEWVYLPVVGESQAR
jgi:hypothetical protein